MYCRKCGHQLKDDAKFCSFCGEKVVSEEETVEVVEEGEEKVVFVDENKERVEVNTPVYSNKAERGPWKTFAKVGQILGIVFICLSVIPALNYISLIFSEIGIVLSALGLKSKENKGKATTGLVLNIVAFVLSIILYFVYLIVLEISLIEY